MLERNDPGGGVFALFLCPHPGAFRQLMCPTLGNLRNLFKKMLMPEGLEGGGGGGGGGGWALLELTDA